VALSLLPAIAVLFYFALASGHRFLGWGGGGAMVMAMLLCSLPAIAGTILGWMGLHDIRTQPGRLRGLPFAVFATLTWPLMILLAITLSLAGLHFCSL